VGYIKIWTLFHTFYKANNKSKRQNGLVVFPLLCQFFASSFSTALEKTEGKQLEKSSTKRYLNALFKKCFPLPFILLSL